MTTLRFFATSAKNIESLLAQELRELSAADIAETRAGASFSGSLESAYRVCLWSRLANRVLLVLTRFPAPTPEALYAGVQTIDWRDHLDAANSLAVDAVVSESTLTHSHFAALKVKDAIVDQFREHSGSRPSVQTQRPDVRVNLYLRRDEATISLDLSGDSLHRRGYREQGVAAPLKENLAAAILLRSGWREIAARGGPLIDPMCGSGTLPIEAALIAADIAPGLQRTYWGFLRWKQHDEAVWRKLTEEAQARRAHGLSARPAIRGYDEDPGAVRIALANVERAGLRGTVHIERRSLDACAPAPGDAPGLVVVNPPYGHRLGAESELPALYERLGAVLKQRFCGWRAAVFTGNPDLGRHLGLRATRLHTLYNGAIECKLLHFDITPERFSAGLQGPRPRRGVATAGARMFANRLEKNRRNLGRWLKREAIHCYRLYDADLPEYAIAVDVYGAGETEGVGWVHVQEYEAPKSVDERKARERLREALGALLDVLQISEEQLFFKVRRQQKGRAQYEKFAETRQFHQVEEGGCRFLVNFKDYLDTGLFLDHRITRGLIQKLAKGRHFLNLFGYTGTASVYAAKGGASSTATVDMSRTYLDWARRNMALNGFAGVEHTYVQSDCLEWVRGGAGDSRYGLIFLDPPSFSTSKRMESTFDVQRDHVALIRDTAKLLEPNGILIFSTNLRRFKLDREALGMFAIEDISRATLPKDFERNPRIHSCWQISRHADGSTAGGRRKPRGHRDA